MTPESTAPQIELLAVGRVGVDLYPDNTGPLKDVRSFTKSLGGTATNVAVGAARLGHSVALVTKVGPDNFGVYVREALDRFGVDTRYVGTADDLLTPVVFCELDPPEDPPMLFYRLPVAPDLTLSAEDVPWTLVDDVPILWVTGTGVSVEPARSTQMAMLKRRGRSGSHRGRHTILDLDWRPGFWASTDEARAHYDLMLGQVSIVVGNRSEIEVALGTRYPDEAADRLLARGLDLVMVKMGAAGVLVATPNERSIVAPHPIDVVCGLGAGDAFGAALVHGIRAGWDPVKSAQYANAAGALVASRLACADAMPSLAELEAMIHRKDSV